MIEELKISSLEGELFIILWLNVNRGRVMHSTYTIVFGGVGVLII